MGEFSPPPPPPPFSEPPSFFFFLIPQILTSNTSTRLRFYYIIAKIHPPFQNPGSAPVPIYLIRVLSGKFHSCPIKRNKRRKVKRDPKGQGKGKF